MRYYRWIIILIILGVSFLLIKSNENFIGNFHTHTTCSDGKNSYEEIIEEALRLHFKFIAITDHEFCQEVIDKCLAEKRILCIPGQEVTTSRTHLVALNINREIDAKISLKKQVEEIHKQGGIAIAAHPYLQPFQYEKDELENSDLDAMECTYNKKELHPLPCVFDSDAHEAINLNYQSTACPENIKNFSELKEVIITGKCFRTESATNLIFTQIKNPYLLQKIKKGFLP